MQPYAVYHISGHLSPQLLIFLLSKMKGISVSGFEYSENLLRQFQTKPTNLTGPGSGFTLNNFNHLTIVDVLVATSMQLPHLATS